MRYGLDCHNSNIFVVLAPLSWECAEGLPCVLLFVQSHASEAELLIPDDLLYLLFRISVCTFYAFRHISILFVFFCFAFFSFVPH